MSANKVKENKMGVLPVPKLLLTMSAPMVVSMLMQAMYNVVDSVYVSRIGEDALTAVSLCFPVQNLMIAVCAGTGVGMNAYMSRNLGAGRREEANKAARNGYFLAACGSIAFLLFGIFGSRAFFAVQNPGEAITKYGHDYLSVVCILSFGVFLGMTSDRLLQGTGRTMETMYTLGLGALINILLDPILIFGMFGLPRMETAGAAWATVIGQIVSMLLSIWFNVKRNTDIDISMRHFRPDLRVIGIIYRVGVPSILMQSIGSVMTFCMNRILLFYSTTAVSVFGVYFKLQSFIFMPVFGMNNGLVPIVAYNYGARRPDRIRQAIRCGAAAAMSVMGLGFLIFQIFPRQLLGFFDASEEMLRIGIPALRIISITFIAAGLCIVLGSTFQALGNSVYSLISSIVRQLALLIPSAWLLSRFFGLTAVWWAFPIAELGSLAVSLICFGRIRREILIPLEMEQDEEAEIFREEQEV